MRQAHGAAFHRVFDVAHDQLGAQFLRAQVAEVGHLVEVVAGVYHQQRVGDAAHAESFFRALEHHQRILAARKQQGRALKGGRHFTQDEDGFFFQRIEVGVGQPRDGGRRVGWQQVGGGTGVHRSVSAQGAGRIRGCLRPW
jgi:hypothetical protein